MTRRPAPVTRALLDEMSGQGDAMADDVMRRHLEWLRDRADGPLEDAPVQVLREMTTFLRLPEGPEVSPYDEYLAEDWMRLPEWATGPEAEERARRGAAFFDRYVLHIGTALFCGSLPAGYASPRGARVLELTGRLGDAPVRRVAETAQFLVDVMADGGLARGRRGYEAVQRVRMMHAAIRHFIEHDPALPRSTFHPAPPGGWCDGWGRPLNQEDLLGALLTFTVTVFDALDTLRVDYDEDDLEDYLFRWCVIGHLIGIRDDILPLDRAAASSAAELIRERQCERSDDGRHLTQALVAALQETMPRRIADGLIPATVRWYVGDEVADLLSVERNRWTRCLSGRRRTRPVGGSGVHRRVLARARARRRNVVARAYEHVVRRIGAFALKGFLDGNRPGDGRPPFELPGELRSRLPRGPRAFRLLPRRRGSAGSGPDGARRRPATLSAETRATEGAGRRHGQIQGR